MSTVPSSSGPDRTSHRSTSNTSIVRRLDRKRRNQRITAGIVGIAVFVATIWIVMSGGALDRSTPAVPGSKMGPAQTTPPNPAVASGEPNWGRCSDGARARLVPTDVGDRFRVRFVVHRSPVGHSWRIVFRHSGRDHEGNERDEVIFVGIRVASEDGDLVVRRSVVDWELDFFTAKARDTQTGELCWDRVGVFQY